MIIGDTPLQALLEKIIGHVGGFIFVAIGMAIWLPTLSSMRKTKSLLQEISRTNRKLAANEVRLLRQARERKQIEQAVRDSEAKFRSIYESSAAAAANRRKDKAAAVAKVSLDCTILLVEDGPDNQRLISFVLKKAGAPSDNRRKRTDCAR